MMSLHVWLSFVLTSTVLVLIPGPTVLQCIGDALANPNRQKWSTIAGVGVGDVVAMSLCLMGAGALLRASATAFTVVKMLGAFYIMYLGVRGILSARQNGVGVGEVPIRRPETALSRFTKASTITMLNPKYLFYFVVFVPRFLSSSSPLVPQAGMLLVTFVVLGMLNAWMYMSLAGVLGSRLRSPRARRNVDYASGGVLLAAGVVTLVLKRR